MLMQDAFDKQTLLYLIQRAQVFLDYNYGLMVQSLHHLRGCFSQTAQVQKTIVKKISVLHRARFTLEGWMNRLAALEPYVHESAQKPSSDLEVQSYYWFLNDQAHGFESLKERQCVLQFFLRALRSQLRLEKQSSTLSSIQALYYEIDTCLDALRSLIHIIRGLLELMLQQGELSHPGTFSRFLAHCQAGGLC